MGSEEKIPRLITGDARLDAFFERWAQAIEYALNTTGVNPIRISKTVSGNIVSGASSDWFWGKITSNMSAGSYEFVEVFPNDSGTWTNKPSGLTGNCTEFNLNQNVSIGNVVMIYRFPSENSYRFQRGSC
jgi:hypothetical protein